MNHENEQQIDETTEAAGTTNESQTEAIDAPDTEETAGEDDADLEGAEALNDEDDLSASDDDDDDAAYDRAEASDEDDLSDDTEEDNG